MSKAAPLAVFLLALSGCRALPTNEFLDPIPTDDPVALEQAAIIADAKASMYENLAQSASGRWARLVDGAKDAADSLGAPAVLTGLVGAAGGFLVPSPSQRRRERLAAAEASMNSRNQAVGSGPASV